MPPLRGKPPVTASAHPPEKHPRARWDVCRRLCFITLCACAVALCMCVYTMVTPLRAIWTRLRARARTLRPKVHLTTHEGRQRNHHDATSSRGAAGGVRDTLLLLHGFPDCPMVWADTVRRLTAAGFRCVVASFPGCRGQPVPVPLPLPEVARLLNHALHVADVAPVTVVAHDLGAVYARLLMRLDPLRVHRLVLLQPPPAASSAHRGRSGRGGLRPLCAWLRRTLYCLAYGIGHPFGTVVMRALLHWLDYESRPAGELHADMAWPYVSLPDALCALHETLPDKKVRALKEVDVHVPVDVGGARRQINQQPHQYKGTGDVPTLCVYGEDTRFVVYEEEWVRRVRATMYGQVHMLGGGHWFLDKKHSEVMKLLLKWLERSKNTVPRSS